MNWIDEIALQYPDDEIMRLDGFDDCVVGLVERFGQSPILCYDKAKIIEQMVTKGDMTEEAAEEFYEVNQLGAWVGSGTPCFLTAHKREES